MSGPQKTKLRYALRTRHTAHTPGILNGRKQLEAYIRQLHQLSRNSSSKQSKVPRTTGNVRQYPWRTDSKTSGAVEYCSDCWSRQRRIVATSRVSTTDLVHMYCTSTVHPHAENRSSALNESRFTRVVWRAAARAIDLLPIGFVFAFPKDWCTTYGRNNDMRLARYRVSQRWRRKLD